MTQSGQLQRVRHIVLFKLKDDTSAETVRQIERAFADLRRRIPQIRDLEWGTDMSPEGRQFGHTHAFLVTFDSPADRDAYLPHPARRAFLSEVLKPHLERATVVDYVALCPADRKGVRRPRAQRPRGGFVGRPSAKGARKAPE